MCLILRKRLFPMDYIAFLTGLTQYIPTSQKLGNFQDCVSDMGEKLQGLIDGIPAELASPKSTAFLDNCIEFALTQLYHGKISYDEFARRMGMSRPHLNPYRTNNHGIPASLAHICRQDPPRWHHLSCKPYCRALRHKYSFLLWSGVQEGHRNDTRRISEQER